MKNNKIVAAAAISSLIAMGSIATNTAVAAEGMEKCYGVIKAGKNERARF